jgi:hypothetical protein
LGNAGRQSAAAEIYQRGHPIIGRLPHCRDRDEHGIPVWHRDRDFHGIARYTELQEVRSLA